MSNTKNFQNIKDFIVMYSQMVKIEIPEMIFKDSRNWYKYSFAPIFYIFACLGWFVVSCIAIVFNIIDIIFSLETYKNINFKKLFYKESK